MKNLRNELQLLENGTPMSEPHNMLLYHYERLPIRQLRGDSGLVDLSECYSDSGHHGWNKIILETHNARESSTSSTASSAASQSLTTCFIAAIDDPLVAIFGAIADWWTSPQLFSR